uniref:NADH dehydrogenase subunit 4 n=1 Tax=Charinus carajas TaxID=3045142 RepID=UPI0025795253|nr:NADH dehydrogenase subunit 4 [Charinus carajas]WGV34169.1 NADH dehydrogenase subunit 4 [Charinus carajas]WGV34182.1 NADH dehydrogenase subunit 4 [Charinus carajas]WGV34195.1 NADH dehydrogenase subunit 4 [Charinus carajas]
MLGVVFSLIGLLACVYEVSAVVVGLGLIVVMGIGLIINSDCGGEISGGLGGDLMSGVLVMLSLWLSVLMVVASVSGGLSSGGKGSYMSMMLILCVCLVLSFGFMDFFGFYLFFEAALVPIFIMIVGWGYQPERLMAGVYMMFYTLLASLPLLIGVMSLYGDSGSLVYKYVGLMGWEMGGLWWAIMLIAFFVKSPMFFVHLWLPSAHVEAPVAGSMILAGVLLKLGGYGLFRVMVFVSEEVNSWGGYVISVSLVGGLVASMVCLCQVDLKCLIAYSSVGHMGMAVGGIFSMSYLGWEGALVLMVGHGLCSSGLFCMANVFYERFSSRSMLIVKGVLVLFPGFTLWFFLMSVCNMGAPPSVNMIGEIYLLGSLSKVWVGCMVVMMVMMFVAGAYSLWMYTYVSHGVGWLVVGESGVGVREYLVVFGHWFPLNVFVFSLDVLSMWV